MAQKLTRSLESATRKHIDLILTNLGWKTDESSKDCNVFTERAKTVEQNKKLVGNSPDYVLYESETDEPIAIIEAKRKGRNIDQAIKEAEEKYANPLEVKIIFAYDGAFFKSWHTEAKRELLIDGTAVTQLIPEKRLLRFLKEGYSISEVSPKTKHTRAELINIFKWANDLFRKEGLREGIERFTEFANLLFLKLISEMEIEREEEGAPRILEEQYCWEAFSDLDEKRMMNYINNTVLPYLVDRYNHSGDVFNKELLIRNPKTLVAIVKKLDSIRLMDADSDVKGDAFEYFLKDSVIVGNDLGEYFTPRHLVKFMIELIEPKFGEKIYDPTCGTGGFLIAAFNYIKKRCANTKENNEILKGKTVYGRELTNTARIAKMNMILTGDGHTNIKQMDSLANPIKEEFDVVLANPPYGQQTDYGDYYSIPSNSGDAIFIQHIYTSLKEGGRAAVVVPEGLLFRGNLREVRKFLLKNCDIEGVISLPQGIFRPYANNKTNIIVFRKDSAGTKKVWFYNLMADGFDLKSDLRRPVNGNDIPDLLSKWSDRAESSKSWIVNIETIEKTKYELLVKTYKPRLKIADRFQPKYPLIKFSEIMTEDKKYVLIDNTQKYQRVRVQWYGKGVVKRDKILGRKLKTKKQKIAKTGQFIVAEIDAKNGSFGIIPKELDGAIVSSHYFLFDLGKTRVLPQYFDYLIRYGPYEELIQPKVKGTTNYAAIRPRDVLDLEIPLPSIEAQKSIVERFAKQESIIENTSRTTSSIKEGIVDRTDFDGDWQFEDLENLCEEITSGGTPSRTITTYFKGNIPWVKISDLVELEYVKDTEEKITKEALENSSAKMLSQGTVLVSIFATIAKVSILDIDACTNQAIASLKPKSSKIMSEYLMYYLHTLKPYYIQKARGVSQKNINLQVLKSVKIPVPHLSIQKSIVEKINSRKMILDELEKTRLRAMNVIKRIVENIFGINHTRVEATKNTKLVDFKNNS
ncbi:MAG: N-6 DNA methylase [Candidatus Bathyarchaeota archaeon]|nr:N-6 DNA methylase [Candidatus Bathyarchaeota archaeon]